jgi:hypothetical protein
MATRNIATAPVQNIKPVSIAGREHQSVRVRIYNHNTGKTVATRLDFVISSDTPSWVAADRSSAQFNADGKRHGNGARKEPMTIVEILPF